MSVYRCRQAGTGGLPSSGSTGNGSKGAPQTGEGEMGGGLQLHARPAATCPLGPLHFTPAHLPLRPPTTPPSSSSSSKLCSFCLTCPSLRLDLKHRVCPSRGDSQGLLLEGLPELLESRPEPLHPHLRTLLSPVSLPLPSGPAVPSLCVLLLLDCDLLEDRHEVSSSTGSAALAHNRCLIKIN